MISARAARAARATERLSEMDNPLTVSEGSGT
jgi:hypothetical protein